jgi:DnaJ family protein C protein 19
MKWIFVLLVIWAAWQLLGKKRAKVRPPVTDEIEARQVLGLDRGADADDVRAAHRRLVAQVHPDRGGSAELTRRVNAARDLLLTRLG